MDEKPRNRRLRFSLRTLFEVIAVAAFILTLIYYRTTATKSTGRFQKISESDQPYQVLIMDTETGHLWSFYGNGWNDRGEPPGVEK
jgi:hypothetical protein